MKKIITSVSILFTVVSFVACNKVEPKKGNGTIIPRITEVSTKAPVVTTENFASLYGAFKMDIFNTVDYYGPEGLVTGRHYVSDLTVNWNGTEASTGVYWISETPLRFWFQAPVTLLTDGGTRTVTEPEYTAETLSFKYDNAAPKAEDSDGAYHDAEYQDDIVFAYNYKEWEEDVTDDYIDIAFKHALSAVKFVIYTDDESFATDMLSLKRVSLLNIARGADFVFNPSADSFDGLFTVSSYRDTVTYHQDFSNADISRTASSASDYSSETAAKKVFMMIPQTLGEDAKLELLLAHTNGTPDDATDDFNVRTVASIAGDTWKPGHVYKYKLKATANTETIRFEVTLEDWTDVNINL